MCNERNKNKKAEKNSTARGTTTTADDNNEHDNKDVTNQKADHVPLHEK